MPHSNSDWLLRLPLSQWPHSAHVRELSRGSTPSNATPASVALYSTNDRSCKNDQPLILARCRLRNCVRPRMPLRFSIPMPRPVSLAFATSCLLIWWLTSRLYRDSFLLDRTIALWQCRRLL